MNLKISFLAKSRAPGMGIPPLPIAHFSSDFVSLEAARNIAFADADKPEIKATSIVIESLEGTITEYWVRSGSEWKIGDPAAVTGEIWDGPADV
jgi:hypothetical protein